MDISKLLATILFYFIGLLELVGGLSCYKCVSTEPGCGNEVNIRLQQSSTCPGMGDGGGENFCVKVINNDGYEETITRECLANLAKDARHRKRMPTVQRHGYCSPARNDDPWDPYNDKIVYCFCNDWNGCNPASKPAARWAVTGLLSSTALLLLRWLA